MFTKNVFTQKDPIAELVKPMLEAQVATKTEELKGNQKEIDKNHNNKIDKNDFEILRGEEVEHIEVELTEEDYYQIGELLINDNIEINEDTMTHIKLKKAPGTSGNITHVHYKGKHIGSITKNIRSGQTRYTTSHKSGIKIGRAHV